MSSNEGLIMEEGRVTPGTNNGTEHGSWQGYVVGYVTALALTCAAFCIAMGGFMTPSSVVGAITVLAIAQMLVHLIFFLHINTAPGQRTNILAFIVTFFVVVLVVGGSLWIMAHLNSNMMPVEQMMRMQR